VSLPLRVVDASLTPTHAGLVSRGPPGSPKVPIMITASIATTTLATIVALLKGLVDEALFRVSKEGIKVTAVDPAHVAMLDLHIPPSNFEGYQATECKFGVDLAKLSAIVRTATESTIHLSLKEGSQQMTLVCGSITRRMGLLDGASMPVPNLPKLDLTSLVTLPNAQLSSILRASDGVADALRFTLDSKSLTIEADGGTDDVRMQLDAKDLGDIKTEAQCRSLYSTDYLGSFSKAVGQGPLNLRLGTDMPLVAECHPSGLNLTFLLAPRIEAE
jgi:proliferating cell nuclear antigen